MAFVAVLDVQLEQHVTYVGLDRAVAEDQPVCDPGVGQALGHQLQHPALALGQPREWATGGRGDQFGDHLRIERGPAGGDAPGRREELVDLQHPILQQVAEARLPDQIDDVPGLDVLGQHQYPDLGMKLLDVASLAGPFDRERRGHPDVEHDQVWLLAFDDLGHGSTVTQRPHHVVPAVNEQPREPFTQQHLVLDDHDTHGSSALRMVPEPRTLSIRNWPPCAATRSDNPVSPEPPPAVAPPTPSSATLTTTTESRRATRSTTWSARACFTALVRPSQATKYAVASMSGG